MVRQAFAAFGFGVDPFDDLFQGIHFKEGQGLFHASVEEEALYIVGSLSQDHDPGKEIGGPVGAMGDDHDHLAKICDFREVFHEEPGHGAVQAGIGLVQKEDARVPHQLDGDGKAFELAAADGGAEVASLCLQAQQGHGPFHLLPVFLPGRIPRHFHPGFGVEGVIDRIVKTDQVLLWHVADLILDLLIILIDVQVAVADGPVRPVVAHDGFDKGGFAGAGSAQDQDKIARIHFQTDIFEKGPLPQALADGPLPYIDFEPCPLQGGVVSDGGNKSRFFCIFRQILGTALPFRGKESRFW